MFNNIQQICANDPQYLHLEKYDQQEWKVLKENQEVTSMKSNLTSEHKT